MVTVAVIALLRGSQCEDRGNEHGAVISSREADRGAQRARRTAGTPAGTAPMPPSLGLHPGQAPNRARARGRPGTPPLDHPADRPPSGGQTPGTSRQSRPSAVQFARTWEDGAWTRFIPQYSAASVGSLNSSASVDEARPQTASDTDLSWESAQPIQPVAVVTNTTAVNEWQNWLVAAGILLGIGGSLLASLLHEWSRPSRERDQTSNSRLQAWRLDRSTHYIDANVIAALVVPVWAIRRRRRHGG